MTGAVGRITSALRGRLHNSGYILAVYLAAMAGLLVGTYRGWFDYVTSRAGAATLPINMPAADAFVVTLAAMPQVVSILFGYFALVLDPGDPDDARLLPWVWGILVTFVTVDVATGVLFYYDGTGLFSALTALTVALVADTIASELLMSLCFGLLVDLRQDATSVLRRFLGRNGQVRRSRPDRRPGAAGRPRQTISPLEGIVMEDEPWTQ